MLTPQDVVTDIGGSLALSALATTARATVTASAR